MVTHLLNYTTRSFCKPKWKYVTTKIKPKLGQTFTVLVELIDRIRMLDNDLIRLDQKLNIFIEMDEEIQKRKRNERLD